MIARRRTVLFRCVAASALIGATAWGLQATVTTRQGVNYTVSSHAIPLSVKVLDFLQRDAHYHLLAQRITAGVRSDEQRALAVFAWTREHLRRTPAGWPIVDDHVWHIIIRGYGLEDQMADVFCTLATYAGVSAFWVFVRDVADRPGLVLSFAEIDGAWRVFDVAQGVVFKDARGRLVDVETLLATPTVLQDPVGASYTAYFERLRPFTVQDPLRAEQQMAWPRLVFELRRAFHLTKKASAAVVPP